jgi:hypothetical protein
MVQNSGSIAKKISKRIVTRFYFDGHFENPIKEDFFNLAFKKNLIVFHERPSSGKPALLITG